MEKKMITLANQKSKIFIVMMVITLFVGLCGSGYAADKAPSGASASEQQTHRVTGKILDAQGQPVIGANVMLKGSTTVGAVTGADGSYALNVPANATLEVSFIGYVAQDVAVGNRTNIDVTLQTDAVAVGEVVVTGFGTGQKKATLTGAISSVSADAIARSSASTASGALVGKIAGLNFRQTDGRPGSGTQMNIRNMGTPLYVIDGIQMDEGQFNNLDFNDIENVVILKDASAAIYGVRAANGVVVVTTKRGKLGARNTISVNATYGVQDMNLFPDAANIDEYMDAITMSDVINGNTPRYSREEAAKWRQGTEKGYVPFDWKKFIFKKGPQTYIAANITGGSENINYYLSVSNLNQNAALNNNAYFNRTNVQMNLDARVGKRFKLGGSINGRIEKRRQPGIPGGDDYWLPRYATFRNLPTERPYANDNPDYVAKIGGGDTNFALLNYEKSGYSNDTWRVMQLTFNAEYDIPVDGLKLKLLGSYYLADNILDEHEYTYKLYTYDAATDTYPVAFSNNNPWRRKNTRKIETINTQAQLTYDKTFGNHTLNAVVGAETISTVNPEFGARTYPDANTLTLMQFANVQDLWDTGFRPSARAGFVGRINYNYSQKYLVELAGRYDGSYLFDKNQRWGFFPSASVGWRISEENFWKNSGIGNVFRDFKVRASYGMVGDDSVIDAYAYLSGYNYKDGLAVLDGKLTVGSRARGLAETTVSWLKAKTLDIGIDFSLFDGRLNGTIDYFDRTRDGLIDTPGDIQIPVEVGFGVPRQNLNSDKHRGMDGSLVWSSNIGEFQYSVGGNFTYSRFYDWDRYKPRFNNSWNVYRNDISHRFGHLNWGLQAIGQFESWEEIANYPIDNDRKGNREVRPGDIKYKDVNGDGVINGMDERPIGFREGSTPILNYGINLSARWKGFDIALDFTGSAYTSLMQDWEIRKPFTGGGNLASFLANDQWRLTDIYDANSPLIPGYFPTSIEGRQDNATYWKSDFWLKNMAYLKLKNFEFGYSLPKAWMDKAGIQQVRVFVSAQNLFTIHNLHPLKLDPETQGGNGLDYPAVRIMSVGVNLKF